MSNNSMEFLSLSIKMCVYIQPETDLEKQVAELLQSSENNLKDQKLLTPAEMKAVEAMNLDDVC